MSCKPCYEQSLAIQLVQLGCPEPVREYRFHPVRRWKFDLAFPEQKIAVEIHGAVYRSGRHTRGAGFVRDRAKIREAIKLGWRVLEYDPIAVKRYTAAPEIASLVLGREVVFG